VKFHVEFFKTPLQSSFLSILIFMSIKKQKQRRITHFLAGTASGTVGVIVGEMRSFFPRVKSFSHLYKGHPFDFLKVRMQTVKKKQMPVSSNSIHPSATRLFLSTIKKNGPLDFYRGVSSPLAFYVANKTLLWGIYGARK